MSNPPPDRISFRATCLRAITYILVIAALLQAVLLEAQQQVIVQFSESGFTELAQSALLASSSVLLLYIRQALRQLPWATLLMFAFVFSSLIREQDALLDEHVFDGAWQILVSLVILPSLYLVIRQRAAFVAEFERYANSFSFGLFAAGFLTTYVFSRLYGRSEMWMALLGDAYQRTFKDAAEEIVELLGYSLILFAVIELLVLTRRWVKRRNTL